MSDFTCAKQFLVTDDDLFAYKMSGLPVEVFCPDACKTVAFGFLETWDQTYAYVSGKRFVRQNVVFFGKEL